MELQNPNGPCAFWSMFHLVLLLCSMSLMIQPINALSNETDRFALLKFKESISNDPYQVLSSWNDSVDLCNWPGISCSHRHQRISGLDLEGYNLRGTISPFIGNLTFLRVISLPSNSFFGEIPQQVGRLFRLQHLNLSNNMLEGQIPVNLSYCSQLEILSVRTNKLSGMIPSDLGSLVKLFILNLGRNNFTGGIPASLGNISSLEIFSVAYNNLVGTVPDELGRLKSLTFLALVSNTLSGKIPFSLFNMSYMSTISIAFNQFNGTLPFSHTLPNLREIGIAYNKFSGMIPESFSNSSYLQVLDISQNNFVGHVPHSLGNLPELRKLGLSKNKLGSDSTNSLDFITSLTNCTQMEILAFGWNNFGGVLPDSLANLSIGLQRLFFQFNQIHGNIPATLENLVNLIGLSMDGNLFTGVIPTFMGRLHEMQVLGLESNKLSGNIPSSIGNLTQLSELYLSNNELDGNIPPKIADCQDLQFLDISKNSLSGAIPQQIFSLTSLVLLNLSQNSLTGSLSAQVGKLKNINALDLPDNNLASEIPKTIGDCESVEILYLQGNSFQGTLPSSLASMRGIQYLDLSRNKLTGKIPSDLQKLRFLLYLNLSFNDLEGEVPNEGVFQNTSALSLDGNAKLCGVVPSLQLLRCPIIKSKQGKTLGFRLIIIIVCAITLFLLFSSFVILCWRKKLKKKMPLSLSTISFLSEVSYKKLYHATNGFSPTMLIGTGSFSSVYKGILDQEENLVAIKVLNLHKKGADKSFIAECNALRNIRHRNLVKILTCCSSMDYNGNEFKALVFEYMKNGSLDKWLHLVADGENQPGALNLIQRLNIAVDVASAVHYLHDHSHQPIIHCDLKPSNVLLDNEMMAHVGDFGLARLISDMNGFYQSQTSTSGLKGTIGYAPPEYALGGEPSSQGDVYSYGILLLEMFTGRRPTDEMFKDDLNLHNFVKTALPGKLLQIVDSAILTREVEEISRRRDDESIEIDPEGGHINFKNPNQVSFHLRKCLVSILQIGLACSEESPNERMKMVDVIRELLRIKNAYLGNDIHGVKQRTSTT